MLFFIYSYFGILDIGSVSNVKTVFDKFLCDLFILAITNLEF